jgi:hypothetical protein
MSLSSAPFWHANGLLVDLADLTSADSVALRAHRISVQLMPLAAYRPAWRQRLDALHTEVARGKRAGTVDQVRAVQGRLDQVSAGQISEGQIYEGQIRTGQGRAGQVRAAQIRERQVRAA